METPRSPLRRAVLASAGAIWVAAAVVRDGMTFRLGPLLVAGAVPVVLALDLPTGAGVMAVGLPAALGLVAALSFTLLLTLAGRMAGPSLLPFGGAVTEAIVFSVGGAASGLGAALGIRTGRVRAAARAALLIPARRSRRVPPRRQPESSDTPSRRALACGDPTTPRSPTGGWPRGAWRDSTG